MNYNFEREIAPNVWLRMCDNEFLKITVGDEIVLKAELKQNDEYGHTEFDFDEGTLLADFEKHNEQDFGRKQRILLQIKSFADDGKRGYIFTESRRTDMKTSKRFTDPDENRRYYGYVMKSLRRYTRWIYKELTKYRRGDEKFEHNGILCRDVEWYRCDYYPREHKNRKFKYGTKMLPFTIINDAEDLKEVWGYSGWRHK